MTSSATGELTIGSAVGTTDRDIARIDRATAASLGGRPLCRVHDVVACSASPGAVARGHSHADRLPGRVALAMTCPRRQALGRANPTGLDNPECLTGPPGRPMRGCIARAAGGHAARLDGEVPGTASTIQPPGLPCGVPPGHPVPAR